MATDPVRPSEAGTGPQVPNVAGFPAVPSGGDDPPQTPPDHGGAARPPVPPRPGRTGRNLPVAIGVGAVLGGLVFLTLLTVKATFLAYMGVALAIALTELAGAFAGRYRDHRDLDAALGEGPG